MSKGKKEEEEKKKKKRIRKGKKKEEKKKKKKTFPSAESHGSIAQANLAGVQMIRFIEVLKMLKNNHV